jgi:hypothetical protein
MNRLLTVGLMAGMLILTGCKSINVSTSKLPESANMLAPLVEKRETLTATGYAVVSVQNHRNPAQQRLMAIRARQMPDAEKRRRADVVIYSGLSRHFAVAAIRRLLRRLRDAG